jgi:hypothetical protein
MPIAVSDMMSRLARDIGTPLGGMYGHMPRKSCHIGNFSVVKMSIFPGPTFCCDDAHTEVLQQTMVRAASNTLKGAHRVRSRKISSFQLIPLGFQRVMCHTCDPPQLERQFDIIGVKIQLVG